MECRQTRRVVMSLVRFGEVEDGRKIKVGGREKEKTQPPVQQAQNHNNVVTSPVWGKRRWERSWGGSFTTDIHSPPDKAVTAGARR